MSHRLSTIKNADHIIVLNADRKGIIEQGNHEQLIDLNGKYKRLLEMQRRDIEINECINLFLNFDYNLILIKLN